MFVIPPEYNGKGLCLERGTLLFAYSLGAITRPIGPPFSGGRVYFGQFGRKWTNFGGTWWISDRQITKIDEFWPEWTKFSDFRG